MNYTGFQLDAFQTCAFQAEANAGEFATYGFVPSKLRAKQRRYTLTIRGQRFTVPEDELEMWLAKQEEELVAEATKPVVVKRKKLTVQKPARMAPKIVAPQDDGWLRNLVNEANRRVSERLEAYRRMLDEDDEEIAVLMMAL